MDWMKLVHTQPSPAESLTLRTGDEVRVWYRILEQGKERLGQFEGLIIRCRGAGPSRTFTVRRVTFGEGVERSFPMDCKTISKIECLRRGRVKRSRRYYLRRVIGKTRIAGEDTAASSGARADAPQAAGRPEQAAVAAGQPSERTTTPA